MSAEAASLPRLLSADEVAEVLGVTRTYVYDVKHRIGFVKLGRVIRFHPDAVRRFIASNEQDAASEIRKLDF